jgi:probable F420-dependent oxidoreductase
VGLRHGRHHRRCDLNAHEIRAAAAAGDPIEIGAEARRAEDFGFDTVLVADHVGSDWSPLQCLASAAAATERIRVGTFVLNASLHHPLMLAREIATLDRLSGGRVELGLGAGWYEAEHQAYAIPFPPLGERFERLEEQLAIITGLWATPVGERFSFSGRHYQVVKSPGLPKPVQQPRPPVIVGGHGQSRTPRLAATYADEYNLAFPPLTEFIEQTARVRAACEAIGRDPASLTFSAALVICCGKDEAEFARRAAAIGREPAELRENGAAGTVDEVVATLTRWRDAGAQRMYLQVLDLSDLEHLELIAAEVAPHVT